MQESATVKRILIECNTTIKNQHPAIGDEFYETVSAKNYLRLFVGRGKYTPVEDELKVDPIYTGIGAIAPVGISTNGFEINCEYADLEFAALVRHLARACTSTNLRSFTPIEVLDFCAEPDPIIASRRSLAGELYRKWLGRITVVSPKAMAIGFGNSSYSDGFTLRFKEINRRITL